jgi:hypothetical protein
LFTQTRREEHAMTRTTRRPEYNGVATTPCLYLAFELGSEEWKLGFTTEPSATPRVRVMPARDGERLGREIADAKKWCGLTAAAPVRSCYEAGRDGFWLHRSLTARGVENAVVDSSSIEVKRRQRRAKSDGLDVRKLLSMLLRYHAGERRVWSVVRVPTVEEEDRRQLHRELRTWKKEHTQVSNRVKGLLASQASGYRGGPTSGSRWRRCVCGTVRRCRRRCEPAWTGNASTRSSCARRSWTWNARAGT